MFVLRESLLECSFCQSDGVLYGIVCCDSGVVDYTCRCWLLSCCACLLCGLHVVHTTVAVLGVVFVKKAVISMMSWEMSRD